MEEDLRKLSRKHAVEALNAASTAPKSDYTKLFTDVYNELSPNLLQQQAELVAHMDAYPEHYSEVRRP